MPSVECPRCGVNVVRYRADLAAEVTPAPTDAPTALTPEPPPVPRAPAGFWIRFLAALLDTVFLASAGLALWIVAWAVFGTGRSSRAVTASVQAFELVIGSVYYILCHWRWGQTFGKMALQIRVVPLMGGPLTLGQSVLRWLGYWVCNFTLGIGYLMAGLRADKRGLHDLIAGTRVEKLA